MTNNDQFGPLWRYQTASGPVYIKLFRRRYHAVYNDESLGSYVSPDQAAEDLAGGHTFSPSNGVALERLGISPEITEWERLR